ncbi:hypothetical protein UFOVP56_65 [uncultured Caudovirales phage]|uniref:Uncharacterized protein n=1 Tax=uncultured Caudovirales phage TaxID=2100421 RepID=A0A6J5T984_9CAUD|nr:hypothetical protein UFOVP56_65 [uncultured Caudovirales phage]
MNWNIFKRLAALEQENKSLADNVATLYNRCLSLETRLVNTQGRFGPSERRLDTYISAVEELERSVSRRIGLLSERISGVSHQVEDLAETAADLGLEDSRLDNILQAHADWLMSHSAKFNQMAVAPKSVDVSDKNTALVEALALVKKLKVHENSRRHYEKSKKIKAAIAAEAAK